MLGALHKEGEGKRDLGGERPGTGIVLYDAGLCLGCRYCQIACPFNVPKFEWAKAAPRIVKCELCRHRAKDGKGPACAEVCPRDAVTAGTRGELLAEARRRIDANPGGYHRGRVYGEADGGGTNVLVLSPVAFETLGLPALGTEPAPALSEAVQHGIYQGFVAPVALLGVLSAVTWRNRRQQARDEQAGQGKEEGR
jgi:ferredoxin